MVVSPNNGGGRREEQGDFNMPRRAESETLREIDKGFPTSGSKNGLDSRSDARGVTSKDGSARDAKKPSTTADTE